MAVTYSIQLRMSPTLFERGKNLSINKEFDVLDFAVTVQIYMMIILRFFMMWHSHVLHYFYLVKMR